MDRNPYSLREPDEVATDLAARLRVLRLERGWKQTTLADRSGVSLGSLRRFESTGQVSLQSLLALADALRRLDEFDGLLQPPVARSIDELEDQERRRSAPRRRRGTI
ncbi:MAG: helix-turn-helix transcriptional regulator [Acidobacteriota bacterium]